MCKKPLTNFPSAMQERKSDSNPGSARKRHSANPCGAWMKWWWVVSLSVSMWGVIIANCCWSHDPIAFCVGSPAQQVTNLEAEAILSYWPRESSKHKGRSEEHQKFFCPTKNPYLTHKFCTNQRLALKMQDGGHAKGQRKATAKRSSLRYSAVSDISKNVILHNIAAKKSVLVRPKKGMITPNMELIANLQTLPSDQEDRRRRALEEKSKRRRNVAIRHKERLLSAKKVLMSALSDTTDSAHTERPVLSKPNKPDRTTLEENLAKDVSATPKAAGLERAKEAGDRGMQPVKSGAKTDERAESRTQPKSNPRTKPTDDSADSRTQQTSLTKIYPTRF